MPPASDPALHRKGLLITAIGGLSLSFDIPLIRLSDGEVWSVLATRSIATFVVALLAWSVVRLALGKRMALSPLLLILALMVFGWLWGILGLLLAVPLLVCVKIVLAKVDGLEGWARLLE